MQARHGERPKKFFRTERVQQANGVWFLLTRESIQEGPFRTRQEAVVTLERHATIWRCNLFSNGELERINTLSLQTEISHRSAQSAANGQYHSLHCSKQAQRR